MAMQQTGRSDTLRAQARDAEGRVYRKNGVEEKWGRGEEGVWEGRWLGERVCLGKAHSPFGFAQGKQEWLCHKSMVIREFCGGV